MTNLLECEDVTKSFGGQKALRGVNFQLRAGEVHALAGENGAGKSTLMHLLAGVHQADSGTIRVSHHSAIGIADERHARQLGIAIVYQERSLFNLLTVAENLFVTHAPVKMLGVVDRRRLYQNARTLLAEVELAVDPMLPLGKLSTAQQQMVEIAKALSLQSKVLILDEPTAALTLPETQTLFRIVRQLKQKGVGIIYISHRLEEIFSVADRVSILKDGAMQGTWNVSDVTPEMLVTKMVGREVIPDSRGAVGTPLMASPRISVRNLCDRKLKGISFEISAGEILGMAGLAGAGRTETAMAIFGCRKLDAGEVLVDGRAIDMSSPRSSMAAGIGYLPEDRKELGLFLRMGLAENLAAAQLNNYGAWLVNRNQMKATAQEYVQKLRIAVLNAGAAVGTLSGGNQQKVLLGRWLLRDPKVLIVDEPTRGVDVGAKSEIHRSLRDLADKGAAVLLISSELPEILRVSDRILVMREGRVAAIVNRQEATEESLLQFAALPSKEAA